MFEEDDGCTSTVCTQVSSIRKLLVGVPGLYFPGRVARARSMSCATIYYSNIILSLRTHEVMKGLENRYDTVVDAICIRFYIPQNALC